MSNESSKKPPRVLMIGPLPPNAPTKAHPIGGAAVNFAEMIKQLEDRDFVLNIFDINRPLIRRKRWQVYGSDISVVCSLVVSVIRHARQSDVVFLNGNAGFNILVVSVLLWIICRLLSRPFMLRFFGGDFASVYDSFHPSVQWIANSTFMKCESIFVQTLRVRSRFSSRDNFHWFPNTRDIRPPLVAEVSRISRFVFVSRLYMKKGLKEALVACLDLPDTCHLDVYGPIMPDTDLSLFHNHPRATYKGVLAPADVADVVAGYDVLLFPTYWEPEGYPGIVIEALQCGVPVIATRWNGIPEVVEHEKSGLLVEPRSSTALRSAICRLLSDSSLYVRLRAGAIARGAFFRSGRWYDMMAALMNEATSQT